MSENVYLGVLYSRVVYFFPLEYYSLDIIIQKYLKLKETLILTSDVCIKFVPFEDIFLYRKSCFEELSLNVQFETSECRDAQSRDVEMVEYS